MKPQSLLAFTAIAVGALISTGAHAATITDSLTGPNTGSVTTVTSALSAPTPSLQILDLNTEPQIWANASKSYGNSRFGVNYGVQGVTAAWSAGQSNAQNYLSTQVTVFGTTKTAIQASLTGATNQNTQTASVGAQLYALGNLVRNGSHTGGDFTVTPTTLTSFSQQLYNSGTQTFWIGPIPISVGVSVNANAWQSVFGHVWVDGIDGTFNQSAGIFTTAFGGVGVSFASGGVKVNNLSLLNASLKLASKGQYTSVNWGLGACYSQYTIGENYGVQLQELSGAIDLYGQLFGFSGDYQIASWPGIVESYTVGYVPNTVTGFGDNCYLPVPAAPQIVGNGILIT